MKWSKRECGIAKTHIVVTFCNPNKSSRYVAYIKPSANEVPLRMGYGETPNAAFANMRELQETMA